MPQRLLVYQSLWAMERRRRDEPEWPLDRQLAMIHAAGFDGAGLRFIDPGFARDVTGFLRAHGMSWQAQCYPKTVADLEPVLALVDELGADHINLQPDIRPYDLADCIPYIEGWRRTAADAGLPMHIETHRDRMTTDLFFTLHLLDRFPDLRLTGDISHYLVGREFAWPVSPENHALMHRILDNCWALHGRVASREQIQVQLDFPNTKAGSRCSWDGGSMPYAPGAGVPLPTRHSHFSANWARRPTRSLEPTGTNCPTDGRSR